MCDIQTLSAMSSQSRCQRRTCTLRSKFRSLHSNLALLFAQSCNLLSSIASQLLSVSHSSYTPTLLLFYCTRTIPVIHVHASTTVLDSHHNAECTVCCCMSHVTYYLDCTVISGLIVGHYMDDIEGISGSGRGQRTGLIFEAMT